jgi:hypothetical protein
VSSYKVLAPCVVRQDGGKSAVHYRQIGGVIDVEDQADADLLVAGRFLEPIEDDGDAPEPEHPPTPPADSPVSQQKPDKPKPKPGA